MEENLETVHKLRTRDILQDFFRQRTKKERPTFREHIQTPNIFEKQRHTAAIKSRLNVETRPWKVGVFKVDQRILNKPLHEFYERSRKPIPEYKPVILEITPTRRRPPEEPVFPPRPSRIIPLCDGNKLMRRPTVESCDPVTEADEFFQYLSSFPDLKPFSFEDNALRTLEFYLQKYPLLLRTPSTQETATIVVNRRRVRSPEIVMQRHRTTILAKQREMDAKIKDLEHDSSDCFISVLKSKVFDPQSWPWNEGLYSSRPGSKQSRPTSKMSRPASKQSRPSSKASY